MKKLLLSASLVLLSTLVFAQNKDSLMIKKISDDVMQNGTAYKNLRVLCKQVGPRLSGSPQAQKAVEQTAKIMKEMGADTVYLQECMVPHWVRGKKEETKLIYANGTSKVLKAVALGNSIATPAAGITAPVIEVKSFAELEQLGRKVVEGKIVFFNYPMNSLFINTFRAYGDAIGYRVAGPSIAAKYGAKAIVIRSLASNPDDHPHTGVTVYADSLPKIPALALSTNDAEFLSRELKKKMVTKLFVRTSCQMLPDAKSYNVVGEIRGTDFPDEIITVGGHLDSWDLAEGAHDDGTGCVQSMEVIRIFRSLGIKPRRTIRAVMFMNEENGGHGGDKYAELAKASDKKFIFALESDAGGFTPRGLAFSGTQAQKAKIWQWQTLFEPYGVESFVEGGGEADIEALQPLGTVVAGLLPDSQRYFDVHHAETDVLEAVSPRELNLGAINMAGIIYLISEYGL
ncbi:MAG: peptidase M28 family protein [Bacteroidetes bacterium]|nr:MAG: peptidase M28 family protein [Bacteroidota bacterium]